MHIKDFGNKVHAYTYLYLLILWHYTKLTVRYTILKFTKIVASIASKASLRGNQYYSHHYIFAIAFLLLVSCIYTHAYIKMILKIFDLKKGNRDRVVS